MITESVAYEFGAGRGLVQYQFPTGNQPDTEEDNISLGFITSKADAVLLRIESSNTQDYFELEIVRSSFHRLALHEFLDKHYRLNEFLMGENVFLSSLRLFRSLVSHTLARSLLSSHFRLRAIFSLCLTLAHTIYRWARSESKSAITPIMLSDLPEVEAMQHFRLMTTMFKRFTLKVRISFVTVFVSFSGWNRRAAL
jgi:hypothetical protein